MSSSSRNGIQLAPTPWFAVRREFGPRRTVALSFLAFVLPFVAWCAISYLPFVWHPKVLILEQNGTVLQEGKRYDPPMVERMNAQAMRDGKAPAVGQPANPVFLPAPHEVVHALYTVFTTPPRNRITDKWFHQRVYESLRVIFWGFAWASLLGVPMGILCGTFALFSKLNEPFIDFVRYMPAPAFGTLMVAVLGTQEAPKVAIIFIGTFFQMVLVLANTTRQIDTALLEAAQTLGARRWQLLTHVVIPGVLPRLYIDMRILLGWAWTYLIVAELIGEKSGITAYIQQQGRYFNFERVYAGIVSIGLLGLGTDQILQVLGWRLFPAQRERAPGLLAAIRRSVDAIIRKREPVGATLPVTQEAKPVDGDIS